MSKSNGYVADKVSTPLSLVGNQKNVINVIQGVHRPEKQRKSQGI